MPVTVASIRWDAQPKCRDGPGTGVPSVLEHFVVAIPRRRFINVKMLTIWAAAGWLENVEIDGGIDPSQINSMT